MSLSVPPSDEPSVAEDDDEDEEKCLSILLGFFLMSSAQGAVKAFASAGSRLGCVSVLSVASRLVFAGAAASRACARRATVLILNVRVFMRVHSKVPKANRGFLS